MDYEDFEYRPPSAVMLSIGHELSVFKDKRELATKNKSYMDTYMLNSMITWEWAVLQNSALYYCK
jgi:hypothetical protein